MTVAQGTRARELIERVIRDDWGWEPKGVTLTAQQRAGMVLNDARSRLRDYGLVAELRADIEPDGSLRVTCTLRATGESFEIKVPPASEHHELPPQFDLGGSE